MKPKQKDKPKEKCAPLEDLSGERYQTLLRWLYQLPRNRVRQRMLREWKLQVSLADLELFWQSEVVQQDRQRYLQVVEFAREVIKQAEENKAPIDEAICEKLKAHILMLLDKPDEDPKTIKILHDILMREKQHQLNCQKAKAAPAHARDSHGQESPASAGSDEETLKKLIEWVDKLLLGKL